MNIQEVHVQRVSIVTTEPFDTVVARIDAAIGHPNMVVFRKSFSAAQNEAEMQEVVNAVIEPNGLMEFMRFDLGEVKGGSFTDCWFSLPLAVSLRRGLLDVDPECGLFSGPFSAAPSAVQLPSQAPR